MLGDLRAIARALGGNVIGRDTVLCPGPGHSRRDRSLAFRLDPRAPDGFVCNSHAGDDWKECRDYVRQKLGMPAWEPGNGRQRWVPQEHVPKWDLASIEDETRDMPPALSEDEFERIARVQALWGEAVEPRGTVAETYSREVRRLELPDALAGAVLRFHRRCPWRDENTGLTEYVPALIAAFPSIESDAITAVHRIALRPDGTKIDRRMLGIVSHAAIKFDPLGGDTLAVGEGIETCMAAREFGFKPTWALGSVGAISFFPLIDSVKQVTILGETGEASAHAIKLCGTRWRRAGRRVRVVMPNDGLADMNDALIAERPAYWAPCIHTTLSPMMTPKPGPGFT
jgi:putative DNA primase/helicase